MADFLRILHITDLHFGVDGPKIDQSSRPALPLWAEQAVRQDTKLRDWHRAARNSVAETSSERPRFVVVTGDTVETGKPEEFAKAAAFLKDLASALGLDPKERVLVVPGNHDVNWDASLERPGDRFVNFMRAYQDDFTIPRFNGERFEPTWVSLRGVTEGVEGDIALLSSPTFSGVPDPNMTTETFLVRFDELVGRVAADMREALRRAIEDGRTILDIAAVGDVQRQLLDRPKKAGAVRIAALHHHLLPDPQVEVTPFDAVIDAGQVLQRLVDSGFDLVLSGHKHNRRLAQYRYDRRKAVDVYTGPALFRPSPASLPGFTFVDVHPRDRGNYADLSYYQLEGGNYARSNTVSLERSGHVDSRIAQIASEIRPADQGERLVPAMQAIRGALEWRRGHVAEQLFEKVWAEVQEGLEGLRQRRLVLRGEGLPERWGELIDLAARQPGAELQLVSLNDLRFWESAYKVPHSEAARYCGPVRAFAGPKGRVLIIERASLWRAETRARAQFVIEKMVADGIRVRLVWRASADDLNAGSFRPLSLDFGNIGDLAVSRFEAMTPTEAQGTTIIRALRIQFSEAALAQARADWDRLGTCVVWDSEDDDPPSIEEFLGSDVE